MDVGREIRRLREARGWSQAKLAGDTGMGVSGISQIETGARNPSAVTLSKIAGALGVEVGDLFPKAQTPQPSLEDAARSEAFQEALAVLYRALAYRGRQIVQESLVYGPSEVLWDQAQEFEEEGVALRKVKATLGVPPSMFAHDSDELAEAEDDYLEVDRRIQEMLKQDVGATEEERREAQKFKNTGRSYGTEEPRADAS
jgi:transcriptional regulator with XRE-family HTH domain